MFLLFSCGVSPTDSSPTPEPEIVLGTGEVEWEELGDDISVIMGPQGGYHILGSVRARGILAGDPENLGDPNNPTTHFEVLHEGIDLVISSDYVQGLAATPSSVEHWDVEMIGRFAILGIDSDQSLDGESLLFRVSVSTADGVELSDERTLLAYPDPRNNR